MIMTGTGIFMWDGRERRSQRYGFICLTDRTFDEKAAATATLDTGPLRARAGQRVRLAAHVLESRPSSHAGDLAINLLPRQPETGEVIEIGVGTLVLLPCEFAAGGLAVGLAPADERPYFWLDPRTLYRLHDQTVELLVEATDDPEPPPPQLDVVTRQGAISTGDGAWQIVGPDWVEAGVTVLAKTKRVRGVAGAFSATPPTCFGNRGEVFEIAPSPTRERR